MQQLIEEYRADCDEAAARVGVNSEIHPEDFIFRFLIENPVFPTKRDAIAYYFNDGAKSAQKLRQLVSEVCGVGDRPIDLLEFASGFGCLTRQLPVAVPAWRTTACDIHPQAIRFLRERLGAEAMQSASLPEELSPGRTYDVVFALSFFSHMPERTFGRWMQKLASLVRPGGYLIFTAHGAVSHEKFLTLMSVDAKGFGFAPSSEQKDLDAAEYGSTISYAPFVLERALALSGFRLAFFQEGFWWEHQDVYVLRRKP